MRVTDKQMLVLRELEALDHAPKWAKDAEGSYWRSYHVVYFYGASLVLEAGMSIDAVEAHLRVLAKKGLADKDGATYRVSDAGRRLVEEGDS